MIGAQGMTFRVLAMNPLAIPLKATVLGRVFFYLGHSISRFVPIEPAVLLATMCPGGADAERVGRPHAGSTGGQLKPVVHILVF